MTDPHSPTATPEGFDPQHDILLDTARLRALAHPLRVRLLGLLREHGPATASSLARRVNQSSGVTSYHLRQLAASDFVVEDEERGNRRERWWRAAHRSTWFEPADPADPEVRALGEEYMRAVAASYIERMSQFLDGAATFRDQMGAAWDDAWTLSDTMLMLTPAEAQSLMRELADVVQQYRTAEPGPPAVGDARVAVQWQVLPQIIESVEEAE